MARRHNGEGSIYPCRNGFAAYVWIVTPDGRRQRKYVYGKSRQAVHKKWLAMTAASRRGPVAPTHTRLSEYLERWLNESVRPNLAPQTVANYEFFSRAYIGPDLGRNGSTGFGTRRPAVDGSSCPLSVLRSRQGCTPTKSEMLCYRVVLHADRL